MRRIVNDVQLPQLKSLQKSEREKPHCGTNQHPPTQTPCNQPANAILTAEVHSSLPCKLSMCTLCSLQLWVMRSSGCGWLGAGCVVEFVCMRLSTTLGFVRGCATSFRHAGASLFCVTRRKQHRPSIAPNANTTHVPTAGSSAAPTKPNHTPTRRPLFCN